ncbi:MAG TPA: DoxX family protein, partial [Nocardioidaceae bacterium]|nr:DoxX family protein [Nocardioidaceae bacterium]
LVNAGLLKLTADPAMVDLFADIGAGQWLRVVVGAIEVAGAVGLLVPALSGRAALGVTALMTGAAGTNVFVIHESPWLPIALLAVAGLVGYARRARTVAFVETLRRRTIPARQPVGRTA